MPEALSRLANFTAAGPMLPATRREKLRIAHVIPGLAYGGMERVLHSLVHGLERSGFEQHVIVLEELGRFAEGLEQVAEIHQIPPMSKLSMLYPRYLAQLFRSMRPAVIHSHAGTWFKASLAARIAGSSAVVHTQHGRPHPDRVADRLIDHMAAHLTDSIIAVSEPLADQLRGRVRISPAKIEVIPNGVDTALFRPPADAAVNRTALSLPINRPIIGSVGRLEPVKNYRLALDALSILLPSLPQGIAPPLLALVGDGTQRGELQSHAGQLGLHQDVRFLGWQERAEAVYGAFDIFTLCSHSEGMSMSLLEAMSTGLCPVVTDVGGNRSVLGDGLESQLVPPGEPRALAEAWRTCLVKPQSRSAIGGRARERVLNAFSLKQLVMRHEALYFRLATHAMRFAGAT